MKLAALNPAIKEKQVTPFVGVWIETKSQSSRKPSHSVTPFVGVWIET